MTSHEQRYRMVLPLGVVFALGAIAATVVFIVYAVAWSTNDSNNMADSASAASREQQNRKTKVEYAYQATVMALLALIVFFNGYHLTKIRM